MHHALAALVTAVAGLSSLPTTGLAQLLVPDAFHVAEADNNTAHPWGRGMQQARVLYVYDSSHFTGQGITAPIVITRLRWRAEGTDTRPGYVYGNVLVKLSTAAVDHASVVATFATNHGSNLATVHAGPVAVVAQPGTSPNGFCVDLPTAPFVYDPSLGDLAIEIAHDGSGATSVVGPLMDATALAGCGGSRVYDTTNNWQAPMGTVQQHFAPVIEIEFMPAAGTLASFWGTSLRGTTPLQASFTDRSESAVPGGIVGWQWDFDGDTVVDSTSPNPTFTYTTCGTYNVALTVFDAALTPHTFVRPGYVVTDEITAGFTWAPLPALGAVQLTDTTSPPATAWAWDFDGDSITDSTQQHPVAQLPLCETAHVRLDATRYCRTASATRSFSVAANRLTTQFPANNNGLTGWGMFFDLTVLNPSGINICGLDTNTGATAVGTPFTLDVWLCDGGYAAVHGVPSAWRLWGTATGLAAGNNVPSAAALPAAIHLAPGSYGVALYHYNCQARYNQVFGPVTYANTDLRLDLGLVRTTLFGTPPGSAIALRSWSGTVHYDTIQTGGLAGFGFLGTGCAGTLPPSRPSAPAPPRLGAQFDVTFDRLPFSAALPMLGFSHTLSTFGPLPIDLTVLGAPGCIGRVNPELTWFVLGSNQEATLSVLIPASVVFQGVPFFTQALVFDTAANVLGLLASDAAAAVIGN